MKSLLKYLFVALFVSGCAWGDQSNLYYATKPCGLMACKDCNKTITKTKTTQKVTLPSIGASGITVNFGGIENDAEYGQASPVLGLINAALVQCCQGETEAAKACDSKSYNFYANLAKQQTTKLLQLQDAILKQPAPAPEKTNATATAQNSPAPKKSPSPTAATTAKQKVSLPKWVGAYKPKTGRSAEWNVPSYIKLPPMDPKVQSALLTPARQRTDLTEK